MSDENATKDYSRWTIIHEDDEPQDPGPLQAVRVWFDLGTGAMASHYLCHFVSLRKDGTLALSKALDLDDPRYPRSTEQAVAVFAPGRWLVYERVEAASA